MSIAIDPKHMTPEERAREVARILSRGIVRLQSRHALPAEKLSKDSPDELEVGPRISPHGDRG